MSKKIVNNTCAKCQTRWQAEVGKGPCPACGSLYWRVDGLTYAEPLLGPLAAPRKAP